MEHIISVVWGGVLEENKIEIWMPIHSILEYKSSKESKYNKKYAKVKKKKKQSLWMKRWKKSEKSFIRYDIPVSRILNYGVFSTKISSEWGS